MMNHGLMSMKETAALLGVSRQRLAKLIDSSPDFPEPLAVLAVGRIWRQRDVERWARKHGRTVILPADDRKGG
jgi:prophage regulatory protein